ncbi:DCC1-like thiol-disulfide oxidoreductase family protein [Cutibacterium sp.]|uniref:DCC1-like thiol-disulfide oxidoreductase family protein n=1 Tax=Cutibacterium sp. TaxID=1912221 RepID=UPI0034C5CBB9
MQGKTSITRACSDPATSIFLYDDGCKVCLKSILFLQRVGCNLEFQPLQDIGHSGLEIDLVRAQHEVPVVQSDGTVVWGFRAWVYELYNSGPLGRLTALILRRPLLRRIGWKVYRFVNIRRSNCQAADGGCESRYFSNFV